jgi:hypothetical protein
MQDSRPPFPQEQEDFEDPLGTKQVLQRLQEEHAS